MSADIVGARIDERLIHGQVATAWTNHLEASRIMVIDDSIVQSPSEKMILKMACPQNCKLSILRTSTAISNLLSEKYGEDRVFIVCKRPLVFLELLKGGVQFSRLVLGNMSARESDAVMLRRSVYVTREEMDHLRQIESFGVEMLVQQTPADGGETLKDIMAIKGGQLWD
ncbi:MAG: PTS sugar transporter subunit IIB [Collinsella sp.]|nr:PTS sugar transporter subunit IIB [Collinsella sp.]